MIKLPTIEDAGDIAGKHVLLRLDLNVPIQAGKVADPYRIDKSISTIDMLRHKKAKTIIVAHTESADNSLHPMWEYLRGFVPCDFASQLFSTETIKKVSDMKDGDVLLLENLRLDPGEKGNDMEFAKKLAAYGDIYINDAFSVSHRSHASIVLLPQLLPHYAGPLLQSEIENLSKAFSPEHPFLFVLGGAKFETKLPLIQKFLALADHVFIAGALANNVFKELGYEVGTSLVSEGDFGIGELLKNDKFIYPDDVVVRDADGVKSEKNANAVAHDEYIGDVGEQTLTGLGEIISQAKYILWNGPLGNFEEGFSEGTEKLAQLVADSHAESIVGGGDTLAAIEKLDLLHKFSFVSTGGGAMLDFLANETLPGIEALHI